MKNLETNRVLGAFGWIAISNGFGLREEI